MKKNDADHLLSLAEQLSKAGRDPAAILHNAITAEKALADEFHDRPFAVVDAIRCHPLALFSPQVLVAILNLRLKAAEVTLHIEPRRLVLEADEARSARKALKDIGKAIAKVPESWVEILANTEEAHQLEIEVRRETSVTGSAKEARAKVAKRHEMTSEAVKKQTQRARLRNEGLPIQRVYDPASVARLSALLDKATPAEPQAAPPAARRKGRDKR